MPTLIGPLPESGNGQINIDSGEVVWKFLVKADNANQDAITIRSTTGLPRYFDSHPDNALFRVRGIDCTRRGNSPYWEVAVSYSTPQKNDNTTTQENDDATLDIAEISVDFEDKEEPITQVYDSGVLTGINCFRSSAGEIYSPHPTQPISTPVITISQNYPNSYTILDSLWSYVNTINAGIFLGAPAHTLRIVNIKPTHETRTTSAGTYRYLKVRFLMKYNSNSWDVKLLDQGSYYNEYITGGIFKQTRFKTDDSYPLDTGLLNGAGDKLPLSALETGGSGPYYFPPKQTYPESNFNALGLPLSPEGYKYV